MENPISSFARIPLNPPQYTYQKNGIQNPLYTDWLDEDSSIQMWSESIIDYFFSRSVNTHYLWLIEERFSRSSEITMLSELASSDLSLSTQSTTNVSTDHTKLIQKQLAHSQPEEFEEHSTTLMVYVMENICNVVVLGDKRRVSGEEPNYIINDDAEDIKLRVEMDYIFAGAGDREICEEIIDCLVMDLRKQRKQGNGRPQVKECADLVKRWYDRHLPKGDEKDLKYQLRKLRSVSILCVSFQKGYHGNIVPMAWVGTKTGSWQVKKFQTLGSGGSFADLEVDTSKDYKTAEEVVPCFKKNLWRASLHDIHTAPGGKICTLKPAKKVPLKEVSNSKGKRKRVNNFIILGKVEIEHVTAKELMDLYGEFDDRSLDDQSVDDGYAIAVRGRATEATYVPF